MKKKIAVLAAAVMLVCAVPAFAADSPEGQNGRPGSCCNNPDNSWCGAQQQGDNGSHHRHGGCWRN